jgi:ABC-type dipeptide/oligopeptide/nickel transport system permease component
LEPKPKKNHTFIIIVIFLFIAFISLYISQVSGYYEFKAYNKKTLTEEAMKKFEEDLKTGKEINVEDYLKTNYVDYSNNVSDVGRKTGEFIESIMTDGLKNTFKVISKLFIE